MEKTQNYNLNKPEVTDPLRVADFNENAEIIDAALSGCARVECGTYVGTGKYGEANPNTLTFSIEPKVVFIFTTYQYGAMANTAYTGGAASTGNIVFYAGGSRIRTYYSGQGEGTMYYTLSGNTLTWYSTQKEIIQMNSNNGDYSYVAIG